MPSPRIVLQNEFCILRFHEAERIVHHEMLRPIRAGAFQELLLAGLALLEQHDAHKWLSDDRKNFVLEAADEEWARTKWFPEAQAAGWKFWAVCPPEKVVGQMQINRHAKGYMRGGVEVKNFLSPDDALVWLKAR